VLAAAISTDWSYGRLYHLPPADAMIDVTQLKCSFCRFAENFGLNMLNSSLISSAFSHIAFLSRLLAGRHSAARPQDSYNLKSC